MTKRTLFIIIGLLVLLDVAAMIIYVAGHYNRDDEHTEAVPADIISQDLKVDRFDTIQTTANFLSTDKMLDRGEPKKMSATIMFKMVWPKEVNGNKNVKELENALMTKITGTIYPNIKTLVDNVMSKPRFAKPSIHFTRVGADFSSSTGASHTTHRYLVFPYFSTMYRLEMIVILDTFNGTRNTRSMRIVHYDRMHDKAIATDHIFDSTQTNEIIALINQSIEGMKLEKKKDNLHEISSIPTEFLLGERSVIFYVEQDSKLYEVRVKNNDMKPFFTDEYNEIINNDSHFIAYEYLTW